MGTSFTPKLTHNVNENLSVYLKTGLQYVAYEQSGDSFYDDEIVWNGIGPVFGAGFQYSFDFGVRVRIDYNHSQLALDRSENSSFDMIFTTNKLILVFAL